MQIKYCDSCGYRIPERALSEGRATAVDGKTLCEKCRPAKGSDKPSKSSNATIPPAGRSAATRESSSGIPSAVRFAESPAPARADASFKTPPKSNGALIGIVAGLAAAVILIGYMALSPQKPPPEPERNTAQGLPAPAQPATPPAPKITPAVPDKPAAEPTPSPRDDPAAEEAAEKEAGDAFDATTRFEGLAEDDYTGRAARLEAFIAKYGNNMVSVRARKMLGELKAKSATSAPAADPAVPPTPPPVEKAATSVRFVKQDCDTHGAWKGVYGTDGYYLANFLQKEADQKPKDPSLDILKKPDYLQDLRNSASRSNRVTEGQANAEACLADPLGSDRHLAFDIADNGAAIVYEALFGDHRPHRVALYFSTGGLKREQYVEILDGATRAVLDKQICDPEKFRKGMYLVWEVTGSVAFQVVKSGTTHPVCSAIFFDPPPTAAVTAQQAPAPAEPAATVPAPDLMAELRKEVEPLLKAGRFPDAILAFDAKAGGARYEPVKEMAARERADIEGLAEMKKRAWAELRNMSGKAVKLTSGGREISGTVKADPKRDDISLRIAAGAEISIAAEQLELADIDALAPHAAGDARKDDLKLRGLIAMLKGDLASARSYFNGAKTAGLCEADDYLKRLDDSDAQDAEAAARRAWTRAESLFQGKQWKDAQAAYEEFEKRWANTKCGADHAVAAKDRIKEASAAQIPYRPGLVGAYFKGRDLAADSLVLTRIDEKVDFSWGMGSPAKDVPNDSFSARWTGFIKIARPGTYVFAVFVDDGTRLTIGGKKVIDQWTTHSPSRFAGTVDMQVGLHEIVLDYFEATSGAVCQLKWSLKDGFTEEIIPASVLFHEPRQEPARK